MALGQGRENKDGHEVGLPPAGHLRADDGLLFLRHPARHVRVQTPGDGLPERHPGVPARHEQHARYSIVEMLRCNGRRRYRGVKDPRRASRRSQRGLYAHGGTRALAQAGQARVPATRGRVPRPRVHGGRREDHGQAQMCDQRDALSHRRRRRRQRNVTEIGHRAHEVHASAHPKLCLAVRTTQQPHHQGGRRVDKSAQPLLGAHEVPHRLFERPVPSRLQASDPHLYRWL